MPLSVGAVALELLEELAFDEDAALEEALLLEADDEALLEEELLAFEEDAALEEALLDEELAALDAEEEALLEEAELAALEEEEEDAELLLPEHLEATSSARPLPAPA